MPGKTLLQRGRAGAGAGRELREAGYPLVYFQQNDDGKWIEKAREPKP